jgi:hypothetical protein
MNWLAITGDMVGPAVSIYQSKKREKEAGANRMTAQAEVDALVDGRQDIPDLAEPIEDLSGQMSNPFGNLAVATQAAEIQMEQSDVALANTLDTLRATGAGAGGATALAQAALKSKQGVAASIEQQEVANQDKAAQGEARLQDMQIAEKQRVQQAEVAADEFTYAAQEERTNADLDRQANLESRYAQMEYEAKLEKEAAINEGTSEIAAGFTSGKYLMPTLPL